MGRGLPVRGEGLIFVQEFDFRKSFRIDFSNDFSKKISKSKTIKNGQKKSVA